MKIWFGVIVGAIFLTPLWGFMDSHFYEVPHTTSYFIHIFLAYIAGAVGYWTAQDFTKD